MHGLCSCLGQLPVNTTTSTILLLPLNVSEIVLLKYLAYIAIGQLQVTRSIDHKYFTGAEYRSHSKGSLARRNCHIEMSHSPRRHMGFFLMS